MKFLYITRLLNIAKTWISKLPPNIKLKPLIIKNIFPISKSMKFLYITRFLNIAKTWISKLPPNIKLKPLIIKIIFPISKSMEISLYNPALPRPSLTWSLLTARFNLALGRCSFI